MYNPDTYSKSDYTMSREEKFDASLSVCTIASQSEWDSAKALLDAQKLKSRSNVLTSGFRFKPLTNKDLKHSFLYLCSPNTHEGKLLAVSKHYYLGIGGFGRVKIVEDVAGKRYALKILKQNSISQNSVNELAVLQELGHLHFTGENGRKNYILMEMVEGINLQDYLDIYAEELTEPQKLSLAYEMVLAIQKLHTKNIVHGDLKPSNFMLTMDVSGKPTLTCVDFGCSRMITDEKPYYSTNNLLGTNFYATPENLTPGATQTISKRTDMYALGKILKHNLHLPSDYGLCNMSQGAVVEDMKTVFQNWMNTSLPHDKLRDRLGRKFLRELRTNFNASYVQGLVMIIIIQGRLLVRDEETQKLIFVPRNDVRTQNNETVDFQSPIIEGSCTYANGKKRGTLIPPDKYGPLLVKQNENLSLFALSKLANVNLKDAKIKTLKSLQTMVRHTNNIDELLSFFTMLKVEESNQPFLSKERGFFRSNAGMTDSWKEAILIFKVRAMELAKNEMNLQKTLNAPDKYRAIFDERRARIFKCNTPTHSREFEKVISCRP